MNRIQPTVAAVLPAMVLLASCARGGAEMDEARLRRFAAEYTAAWSSQEADRVASFYAAEGSLRINDGEASVGREAITAVAQEFMSAFPDMVVEMDSLRVESGSIEYHWTLIGTNTGPGGTGNKVRLSGYEEWMLDEDSLIASSDGHFDEAEYSRQLEHGVDGS